jgi:signal transduction histidine kinase
MAATSQAEALALHQERKPDLTLVNFYLAEGDGLSFLENLKRLSPDSLVLMAAALGHESLARKALLSGAVDYLIKNRDYYDSLPELISKLLEDQKLRSKELGAITTKTRFEAQAQLSLWLDHNLKNILSATMGALNLIDLDNINQSNDKRREYLQDSLNSLNQAVHLLEELSRMNRVGRQGDEKNLLVGLVVDEAWRKVKDKLLNGPAESFSVGPKILDQVSFLNEARNLKPQRVVYEDLFTIFEALLKNALEAVGQTKDPRIVVRAERNLDFLTMSVRDNGRGMDERVKLHAFEPLFSTKGQVGVGLSLTAVMVLVTRRNGQIKIISSPNQGCLIEFTYHVN